MKKKGRQEKSEEELAADSSAAAEQKDLEVFCSSVPIEEISFEHWCQHHSKLDLQYPITIARAQLKLPLKTMIRLSRSIKLTKGAERVDKREKVEHELILEPDDEYPKVVVIHGLGDQLDDEIGDLCIIIHIKD